MNRFHFCWVVFVIALTHRIRWIRSYCGDQNQSSNFRTHAPENRPKLVHWFPPHCLDFGCNEMFGESPSDETLFIVIVRLCDFSTDMSYIVFFVMSGICKNFEFIYHDDSYNIVREQVPPSSIFTPKWC